MAAPALQGFLGREANRDHEAAPVARSARTVILFAFTPGGGPIEDVDLADHRVDRGVVGLNVTTRAYSDVPSSTFERTRRIARVSTTKFSGLKFDFPAASSDLAS